LLINATGIVFDDMPVSLPAAFSAPD